LKRSLPRVVAGTAALLTTSALLVTASPAQAAGPGTIVVNVVDQYGRPVVGYLNGVNSVGDHVDEDTPGGGISGSTSTHTFTVPPGGYSFGSITPWAGFVCFGYTPCTTGAAPGAGGTVTPVVNVAADSTATYTAQVTVPSITGATTPRAPLTLQLPPGLVAMQSYIAAQIPTPGSITQQWVRGTTDIPGATAGTYTPTFADGGQQVSVRMNPSSGVMYGFASTGVPPTPFTTNAITAAPLVAAKTKTKVGLPKRVKAGQKVSATIKVKATTGTPAGLVTIKIGKFKTQKTLNAGKLFFNLPRLSVGEHTMKVTYVGSEEFAKSKAKKTTFTVYE
jgi:Big-like domain-containing protein